MKRLTIGMAVYNDFNGVYFTVEALRAYHNLKDAEILVVDNYGSDKLQDWVKGWGDDVVRYERYTDVQGTTMPRQMVFELAQGEHVICIDSHVLLMPGAIDRLWDGDELIHGPMCYDNLRAYVTGMRNEWRANMWGIWDDTIETLPTEPFEIWGHGLGLFGSRKDTWLGFNKEFKGFGGEEGYIHEKYRKAGRKVMCLPWMKWAHKFGQSGDYPNTISDRIRNYLLGHKELGMDLSPIYNHFGSVMTGRIANELGL